MIHSHKTWEGFETFLTAWLIGLRCFVVFVKIGLLKKLLKGITMSFPIVHGWLGLGLNVKIVIASSLAQANIYRTGLNNLNEQNT